MRRLCEAAQTKLKDGVHSQIDDKGSNELRSLPGKRTQPLLETGLAAL